ncbi:MAG TPA: NAD(P)/FAD-dependent oxidoreductase, partial [Novosphingobium sp.]|nr:NAD(P)/FAD-dependent oxidoreductase [Novosphingobium sp.]
MIIGSGINGLVCAAMLGKKGLRVAVLERADVAGGCIRTGEITLPGYVHDMLSGFHPLFVSSPAYAALGADLHARGLAYSNAALPTGVLLPDGRWTVMARDRAANIARFEALAPGDGAAFDRAMQAVAADAPLTFALLGEDLWRPAMARKLAGAALASARDWLEADFASDELRALFAPWVLHTGLGPDQAVSGYMAQVIAFALEAAGMPVVVGGSARLVEAFVALIETQGGAVLCGAEAAGIRVAQGRAQGVDLADGRHFAASKGVFASVTPQALYGRLLPPEAVPVAVARAAQAFRYGRADMQIHLALDRPVAWPAAELADTAMVHLTGGIDDVAQAVAQANAG